MPKENASEPSLRYLRGSIPDEVLGLFASLSDPLEAASLVTMWDASLRAGQWEQWRSVAAYQQEKILGAVIARTQPGGLATVWPARCQSSLPSAFAELKKILRPPAEDDFEHELAAWSAADGSHIPADQAPQPLTLADRLLFRIVEELEGEGIQLIQSILPPQAQADALALAHAGFEKLADLLYLQCPAEAFATEAFGTTLACRSYTAADHDLLCEILTATYEDTLDCPLLNGLQSAAEVAAGYRQTGQTETSGWRIFFDESEPAGCLLMGAHTAERIAELVYMGLRPESRGHGRGAELVRHAQLIAREWNCEQIVLSVDAANRPARQLYERCGFQIWDSRQAFVRRAANDDR